jgi:putative acetyltransferase
MHLALESVDQPDVIALIDALDAYQGALYPPESNYHLSVEALKLSNVLFCVVRDDDGTARGCGAVVLLDGYGELKRMYVSPAARGRGIARAIITFLELEAARCGCTILRLETGIHQADAIGLYGRAGYERCERYGDYPEDPLSVFMEKKIAVSA